MQPQQRPPAPPQQYGQPMRPGPHPGWRPPPPPPPRRRNPALIGLAVLAAAVVVLIGLVFALGDDTKPKTDTKPVVATKPASAPALTADAVVEQLGKLYPVPNARDNTASCAAKPGDTGKGCVKLITTDSVSVYEFESSAVATRWVTTFRGDGHDWRQAGRFALAWSARDQALTSKEARTEMVAALRKWTAAV